MTSPAVPSWKPAPPPERRIEFRARGAVAELFFRCREREVILSGPAGTGKSRGCLEYVHHLLLTTPRARALMVRKTLTALTASGLVTYREKVRPELDGVLFFGGSKQEPAAFRYPNGARFVVGGLDKPEKVMSTEYDLIYPQEATELVEDEWEKLTTRLRNGVLPFQQIVGDCNPDAPTHWIKKRAERGALTLLESRHRDNPAVTPDYLATLDALTGVRRLRLRDGLWAAAEGLVYDGWDRERHIVPAADVSRAWPRYVSIDFGYTNPFVAQWWAEDPDGRLLLYREIYRSQRLVEDHARDMLRLMGARRERDGIVWAGEPRPRAVICDHDAEDRATLERHLGLPTVAAHKSVSDGIQAVAGRLRLAGDGRPRLAVMRGCTVETDPILADRKAPQSTAEEVESYVWDTSAGRRKGEEPLKRDDHGMDAMRYLVAHLDLRPRGSIAWA